MAGARNIQGLLKDDKRFILTLIAEGEHRQQDFKYRVDDARKLAKTVSAFANTDGGRLLIGVRDDGVIVGVRSEEEIYVMHKAAERYCRPEVDIHFETYRADGHTVVIANVPKSVKGPICAQDEDDRMHAYIRINDENIVASPVLFALWKESQKPQGAMIPLDDDIRKLLGVMEGRQTLRQIVGLSKLPRHKVVTLLAHLIRFGTVKWEYSEQEFWFGMD